MRSRQWDLCFMLKIILATNYSGVAVQHAPMSLCPYFITRIYTCRLGSLGCAPAC